MIMRCKVYLRCNYLIASVSQCINRFHLIFSVIMSWHILTGCLCSVQITIQYTLRSILRLTIAQSSELLWYSSVYALVSHFSVLFPLLYGVSYARCASINSNEWLTSCISQKFMWATWCSFPFIHEIHYMYGQEHTFSVPLSACMINEIRDVLCCSHLFAHLSFVRY